MSFKAIEPTNGQRVWARNDSAGSALLKELDEAVARVNKQEGLIGNLKGKVADAQAELTSADMEFKHQWERAVRIKKAFDVYTGAVVEEDETTPG